MNIRIDDDVPLPEPDKPSTWISTPTTNRDDGGWVEQRIKGEWTTGKPGPITEVGVASDWVTGGKIERTAFDPPVTVKAGDSLEGWQSAITSLTAEALQEHLPKRMAMKDLEVTRYPAEPTRDANGVPTVDCFLVGGPLNGKHGPIVGTAKVVELNVYASDGSVSSVELYELGDRGDLGARYWKGTKQ